MFPIYFIHSINYSLFQYYVNPYFIWASQVALVVKNPPVKAGICKRHMFNDWIREIPWRRAWQPTLVFLPGKSHGQRSLAGCSPLVSQSLTWLKKLSTQTNVIQGSFSIFNRIWILEKIGVGKSMIYQHKWISW